MSDKRKDKNIDELFKAVLQLKNSEECYAFFGDLCTVIEMKAMAQRLEVARLLKKQKSYSEIVEKTGASSATVSRVSRYLNYGNDGYELIIERLDEDEQL